MCKCYYSFVNSVTEYGCLPCTSTVLRISTVMDKMDVLSGSYGAYIIMGEIKKKIHSKIKKDCGNYYAGNKSTG